MPEAPPVTNAVLPLNSRINILPHRADFHAIFS
jgi:hypothetical protein